MGQKSAIPGSSVVPIGAELETLAAWLGGKTHVEGVLYPGHIEQLSDMLLWAADHGEKLAIRGKGGQGAAPWLQDVDSAWVVDMTRMDVPVVEFEQSRMYWMPANSSLQEIENFLVSRDASLGIWAQLYADISIGAAVANGLPLVRQAFYQRGAHVQSVEAVTASGRKIETADAARVAAGMGMHGLWVGSAGQLGAITRVLVSVDRVSKDEQNYLIRIEDLQEGVAMVRTLLQQELYPELAYLGADNKGAYLVWCHRAHTSRDILLSDQMSQLAEGREDSNALPNAHKRFAAITAGTPTERMSIGARFSDVADWLPHLEKRKHGSWLLRVAGTQGFCLETRRPFPKFVDQQRMLALQAEYRQLVESLDPGAIFHVGQAGETV